MEADLGANQTEHIFPFQYSTFPLFFYVNMRLIDVNYSCKFCRVARPWRSALFKTILEPCIAF